MTKENFGSTNLFCNIYQKLAYGVVGHEATYALFHFSDSISLRGNLKDRIRHIMFNYCLKNIIRRTSLTGLATGYGFHNFFSSKYASLYFHSKWSA